ICNEVLNQHFKDTCHRIPLNHITLLAHVNGGQTITDFNKTKQWLTLEEENVIVTYAEEMADCVFPLS
ncbi:hypothetical protein BT96DRAFT_763494, partial [Gymnopus androsaceus JB14]